ncbi:MAG: hypothetical protein QMC78_04495, partial [Methanocellales archaeon]|nr:hypothetical protein [Methanocellales archaeon]
MHDGGVKKAWGCILVVGIIVVALVISMGIATAQPYGDPQIIVSTNRYTLLDLDYGGTQSTPPPDFPADESQTIRIYALKL